MSKKKLSFEESLQRLEQIVRGMEQGDVPLEKSLELFEEGTALVRECGRMLDNAEQQVKKITAGTDGKPVEEDFADDGV